ncbi:MAG: hypothetical protein ABR581_12020 [Thermoleophilaceae bacterium]
MNERLDELVAELATTAERLRDGSLDGDQAAQLVEHCAELAARVGSELDAEARAASEQAETGEGQERLL